MGKRLLVLVAGLVIGLGLAAPSQATVIVLTFEGVGDLNPVGNFYNGGGGPNYGVDFSANTLAVVDADAGGSGNIGGEPSPSTAMFFLTGSDPYMNVAAGFTTGFSFFYSAVNNPGSLIIWDGLNGTGTQLAALALPLTASDGGDPSGSFSPFYPIGVPFSGTAKSVTFGGVQNQIAFDDVTFGSATPGQVPEPTTLSLVGVGLVGLARRARRRAS